MVLVVLLPISFVELDGHLFGMSWSDLGHAALDVVGLVPVGGEAADIANGLWYLAEENYVDAGLALASAIPFAGYAATTVRAGRWGERIYEGIDTANDVRKAVDRAEDTASAANRAEDVADTTGDAARSTPSNPDTPSVSRDATPDRSVPDGCARRNSFVPGTRVVLADGSSKPIEQLQVGDRVLATDVASGDDQSRTVTNVRSHTGGKDMVTVTVDTDANDGTETASFTSTAEHLVWLADVGMWVKAAQLQPGMWLQTGAGTWVQVTAVQHHHATHQQVHNLTVHGLHTYYVLAGTTPVLVHNANCPHRVEVTVHDVNGNVRVEYGVWSGNATPGERALGGWPPQRYTDTENRVARMSGATPRKSILNDPYANLVPVQPGETVVITSLMGKAPCNSCKAAMTDAAQQLRANFVYKWVDEMGIERFWWLVPEGRRQWV